MNIPANVAANEPPDSFPAAGKAQPPAKTWSEEINKLLEEIRQPGADIEALTGQMIQLSQKHWVGLSQLEEQIHLARLDRPRAARVRLILHSEPALMTRLNRLNAGVLNEVVQLGAKDNDPEQYRQLVREGRVHRFDLDRFGRCLRRKGLPSPRASEIVVIARFEETAVQFLNGNYSLRRALEEARSCTLASKRPGGRSRAKSEQSSQRDRWHKQISAAIDDLLRLATKLGKTGDQTIFLGDTGLCNVWFRPKGTDTPKNRTCPVTTP